MPLTEEQKQIIAQVEQSSGKSKKIVESFGRDEIRQLNKDEIEDPEN